MKKILWLVLALSGCGGDEAASEPPGVVAGEAIQGGKKDAQDPAVGLVWLRGGGFCSGTLIAPDVVLTAGHCVADPVESFDTGEGKGTATVGPEPAGGFVKHKVIDQIAHPSYRSENRCPNPTFDVGLLRLAKPIAGATTLAIAKQPPADGATCRAVGYGVHDDGAGTTVEQRRTASEKVLALAKSSIKVTAESGIVDHGDSGGPLLCGGHIVGTTSCGKDGVWPAHHEAYYARVDTIDKWIESTVAAWR